MCLGKYSMIRNDCCKCCKCNMSNLTLTSWMFWVSGLDPHCNIIRDMKNNESIDSTMIMLPSSEYYWTSKLVSTESEIKFMTKLL